MDKRWMDNYDIAKMHFDDLGSLDDVPGRTTLGCWLSKQKMLKSFDKLSSEQISLLENIGVKWGTVRELEWMKYYKYVNRYYDTYGNINIPYSYKVYDIKLGMWLYRQRVAYSAKMSNDKELMRLNKSTNNEIKLLDDLGMIWDTSDVSKMNSVPEIIVRYYVKKYFQDTIKLSANDFLGAELDVYIPSQKIGIEYDGVAWHRDNEKDVCKNQLCADKNIEVIRIREKGLPECRGSKNIFVKSADINDLKQAIKSVLALLGINEVDINIEKDMNAILMNHQNYLDFCWMSKFNEILEKHMVDGVASIKPNDMSESGTSLYNWLSMQRSEYRKGLLSEKHREKLESIGLILNPKEDSFEKGLQHLKKYVDKNGDAKVSIKYSCNDGYNLGKWVSHKRSDYRKGKLSQAHIDKLNDLGFIWRFY